MMNLTPPAKNRNPCWLPSRAIRNRTQLLLCCAITVLLLVEKTSWPLSVLAAVPANIKNRFARFEVGDRLTSFRFKDLSDRLDKSSKPVNYASKLCDWIEIAPKEKVCKTIEMLDKAIHSFNRNGTETTAEESETAGKLEDETDGECELDGNFPKDWSVKALNLPTHKDSRRTLDLGNNFTDEDMVRSELREALYWSRESRRLQTSARTLDKLAMSGRWKPIAILRGPGTNNSCSNLAVVFVSKSSESEHQTDVLIAIRSTMVPADGRINLDMDQDVFKYGGVDLALHRGYSTAAKMLLQQLRKPLSLLAQNNQLGSLTVTGFSMGGGVASALAVHIKLEIFNRNLVPFSGSLKVTTFGSPRFGDLHATEFLAQHAQVESVVAKYDFVVGLPCNKSPICFSDDYFGGFTKNISPLASPRKWVNYHESPNQLLLDPSELNSRAPMEYHSLAYGIVIKGDWYRKLPTITDNTGISGVLQPPSL